MCDDSGDCDGVGEEVRYISEERAAGHLALRQAFLREERRKTVQLMRIVNRKRLTLPGSRAWPEIP